MKVLKLLSAIIFFSLFSFTAFSQIKINPNGEAKVGNEWTGNDYNNEVSVEVFGLNNTTYRPGSKMSFGDYGASANGGANAFIGEWTTGDSDGMQVHGKNGIFFSTGSIGNYDVGKFVGNDFFLRGLIYSNSPQFFSDIRLKRTSKMYLVL